MNAKLIEKSFSPKPLTEQISQVLVEAILEGTLKPGTQLLELELQKQFGVSRSPLREAFRDLEKKGLAVILPRRGTFVREITSRDIKEHFPVRAILEGFAARLAYKKINDKELSRMQTALEVMKRASRNKDQETYHRNHEEFHEIFIKASDNELLIDLLRNLRMQRLFYFVLYRVQKLDIQEVINEQHARIFDAFKSKNAKPGQLEQLVRSHINGALDLLFGDMDFLKTANPSGSEKAVSE